MNIFCEISEWQDKVAGRGRNPAKVSRKCLIIAFHKHSIDFGYICADRTDTLSPHSKSYPNFRLMLPAIHHYHPELDMKDVVSRCLRRFEELTGRQLDDCLKNKWNSEDLAELGRKIDERFKVNYFLESDPRQHLFGDATLDPEDENE